MEREFRLPDIGQGLADAEIVRWLVAEGEEIEADQPVVELETDKAVVEIPCPYAGTVVRHGGREGDVIEVGDILVVVGGAEETPATGVDATEIIIDKHTDPEPAPIGRILDGKAEVIDGPSNVGAVEASRVKALPVVRKFARDRGVDLGAVIGTGPGGLVTRKDVEEAIESSLETPAAPDVTGVEDEHGAVGGSAPVDEPASPASGMSGPEKEVVPLSRLRRSIAANVSKAWSEIPQVTAFDDVDAGPLLEVRQALADRHRVKIPMEALVIKAVAPALDVFPEFNSSIDGDNLVLHGAKNVGIAVDSPDGLLVAVIRDAGQRTVLELSEEVARLGDGAKERKLAPDELTGQTFTISNIGAVGGGYGTPIVPYGTSAILSVGRILMTPIVHNDEVVIAPVMPLSVSYDHRVIDGAAGRRFMSLVMENLKEPDLFLTG